MDNDLRKKKVKDAIEILKTEKEFIDKCFLMSFKTMYGLSKYGEDILWGNEPDDNAKKYGFITGRIMERKATLHNFETFYKLIENL